MTTENTTYDIIAKEDGYEATEATITLYDMTAVEFMNAKILELIDSGVEEIILRRVDGSLAIA